MNLKPETKIEFKKRENATQCPSRSLKIVTKTVSFYVSSLTLWMEKHRIQTKVKEWALFKSVHISRLISQNTINYLIKIKIKSGVCIIILQRSELGRSGWC